MKDWYQLDLDFELEEFYIPEDPQGRKWSLSQWNRAKAILSNLDEDDRAAIYFFCSKQYLDKLDADRMITMGLFTIH